MIRLLRWLARPVEDAAELLPTDDQPPAGVHRCGEFCATWAIAELKSLATRGELAHECTHARRKVGRCARRRQT